jgi:hypothetical protein
MDFVKDMKADMSGKDAAGRLPRLESRVPKFHELNEATHPPVNARALVGSQSYLTRTSRGLSARTCSISCALKSGHSRVIVRISSGRSRYDYLLG